MHNSQPNDRWKVIRQLTNNVTRTNGIIELKYKNETYTDSTEITNVLNTFFSSIGSEINTELKERNQPDGPGWLINRTGFQFQPVTELDTISIISKLANNKKGGKEQIPTFIYKLICPYISNKLTLLINRIITTKVYPDIWKEALVTPIPKKRHTLRSL